MRRPSIAHLSLASVLTFFAPWIAAADLRQDLAAVQRVAEAFLRAQTAGLPGTVRSSVGAVDSRLALPPCAALEAYLPSGARLWGSSTVGVRCPGEGGWSVALPAQVNVHGPVVIATRPLLPGQTLGADDLAIRQEELTRLPAGILSDPAQLVGKSLAVGMSAHQVLREEWVRAPQAIRQGQPVRLVAQGHGFRLSNEGVAVNHALEGQPAQVRLASGRTVRGVAKAPGLVEVVF
ncbi:MAG: flagellar basal body P-ring formation protein FlgA [Betaproteobacteria bacterium]|nr:flagellar basal body P-ring formation protein FlgA [Betaproteobacteria bacterium]